MSGYRMFPDIVKPYLYANIDEYSDIVSVKENKIQSRINTVGAKILNSNKLEERVTFVYDEKGKNRPGAGCH